MANRRTSASRIVAGERRPPAPSHRSRDWSASYGRDHDGARPHGAACERGARHPQLDGGQTRPHPYSPGRRARYGDQIVYALSRQLTVEFGDGFSVRNLWNMISLPRPSRTHKIVHALRAQSSWTHLGGSSIGVDVRALNQAVARERRIAYLLDFMFQLDASEEVDRLDTRPTVRASRPGRMAADGDPLSCASPRRAWRCCRQSCEAIGPFASRSRSCEHSCACGGWSSITRLCAAARALEPKTTVTSVVFDAIRQLMLTRRSGSQGRGREGHRIRPAPRTEQPAQIRRDSSEAWQVERRGRRLAVAIRSAA